MNLLMSLQNPQRSAKRGPQFTQPRNPNIRPPSLMVFALVMSSPQTQWNQATHGWFSQTQIAEATQAFKEHR